MLLLVRYDPSLTVISVSLYQYQEVPDDSDVAVATMNPDPTPPSFYRYNKGAFIFGGCVLLTLASARFRRAARSRAFQTRSQFNDARHLVRAFQKQRQNENKQ